MSLIRRPVADDPRRPRASAGSIGLVLGLALLAAAGLALWRSEGAAIFAQNAFAAVIACF